MELPPKVIEIVEDTISEVLGKNSTFQNSARLVNKATTEVEQIVENLPKDTSQIVNEVINRAANAIALPSNLASATPELKQFVLGLIKEAISGKPSTGEINSIMSGLVSFVLGRIGQVGSVNISGVSLPNIISTVLAGIQQDAAQKAALQKIADQIDREIDVFIQNRPQPHISLFENPKN